MLKLSEAMHYFFDILYNKALPTTGYFWTEAEDNHLLHLFVHSFVNHSSTNISFGLKTPEACAHRIKKLKRIFVQEGLIKKYIIPEEISKEPDEGTNEIDNENNEINLENDQIMNYQYLSSLKKREKKKQLNERMKEMRLAKMLKNIENDENSEIQFDDYSNTKDIIPQQSNIVLQYCVKRISHELKGPYCDVEQKFWLSAYLLGHTPFKFISKIFNGPCINTLKSWIQKSDIPTFDEMQNIENVERIIRWWCDDQIPPIVNVSIDALKIDEDIYINSKKEVIGVVDEKIAKNFLKNIDINKIKRNPQIYTKLWNQNIECNNIVGGIFVIMICPISRLKSFPVHIIVNQNGFATNVIDQRLKDVSKKIRSIGSKPIFISTDSDSHYRKSFHDQFETWKRNILKNNMNVHGLNMPEEF